MRKDIKYIVWKMNNRTRKPIKRLRFNSFPVMNAHHKAAYFLCASLRSNYSNGDTPEHAIAQIMERKYYTKLLQCKDGKSICEQDVLVVGTIRYLAVPQYRGS